ncbi:MoxR family ATPase [bacterium]|nr:MoxR family ATPase [bacterium]
MFHAETLNKLRSAVEAQILGQTNLVNRLLIALLADGHLLVEGAPGLAKTTAIKALGAHLEADFHRLQFTPDLLPSDLIGTDIFRAAEGKFEFQPGPIFHNLVLADEINRAPAKVQSALLEAMAERQVTVGQTTYPLPALFLVMATQNPIEQEGTYRLPEAQLDRFLMHVTVDYPDVETERAILRLGREQARGSAAAAPTTRISQDEIFAARQAVLDLHMDDSLEEYIVQLIHATRQPAAYSDELERWIEYGASPRGSLALERCARAHALIHGRDYVSPDDVQAVAPDVLSHRVLLSFEAEADGVDANDAVALLLQRVPVG